MRWERGEVVGDLRESEGRRVEVPRWRRERRERIEDWYEGEDWIWIRICSRDELIAAPGGEGRDVRI